MTRLLTNTFAIATLIYSFYALFRAFFSLALNSFQSKLKQQFRCVGRSNDDMNRRRMKKLHEATVYQVSLYPFRKKYLFVSQCFELPKQFCWKGKHRLSLGSSLEVRILVAEKYNLRQHRYWTFNKKQVPFCEHFVSFSWALSVSSVSSIKP